MATCNGVYTDYSVFDRIDFAEKMRNGVTIEEYMEAERNAGFRLAIGPGKSGKNRYVVFSYQVDGSVYYGVLTTAYSFDIRKRLVGRSCLVEYDPLNPSDGRIAKEDPGNRGLGYSVACMVMGILSACMSCFVLPGLICGIISCVLFGMSRKVDPEGAGKIMRICGLVFAILGLVTSVVSLAAGGLLFLFGIAAQRA